MPSFYVSNPLAAEYQDLCSGAWAEPNPRMCPCRGRGWLLSNLDTWHPCRFHCDRQSPHPEDDAEPYAPGSPEEGAARLRHLQMMRGIYRYFQETSGLDRKAFAKACREQFHAADADSPQAWIDVAEEVSYDAQAQRREEDARAMGYSCAFEMSMEAEYEREMEEDRY